MVSLQKPETQKMIGVEVKHLMTEEETIAANAPVVLTAEIIVADNVPVVEAAKVTEPSNATTVAELHKRLSEMEKEAETYFRWFMWAVFIIFALLFTVVTVVGLTTPHDPDKITYMNVIQIVLGSLMMGTFMGNILNAFGVHFLD